MELIQAFTLGLVQGVTEFLPISSSGFLILIPEWFGWELQDLAFDAFLHLATLAAVLYALWDDVKHTIRSSKLIQWIILATVPIVLVGFFAQDVVEASFRSTSVVAWSFIIWGIVLYFADHLAGTKKDKLDVVGWKRALFIGCAQVIALIPGTSRSGITITAGLFGRLTRETATRFSFLLGIPTIAAAGLLKFGDVFQSETAIEWGPVVIGTLTAFFCAFFTIKVLLQFLKTHSYAGLAIFRVLLGLMILFT